MGKMVTAHKRMYSTMLDHEIYGWLVEEAEKTGKSQGEIIRNALRREKRSSQLRESRKVAA
jgi:hypothetical protein